MNQPFNAFFELDENTEVGDIGNLAIDSGTGGIITECSLPWIGFKLLYAQ